VSSELHEVKGEIFLRGVWMGCSSACLRSLNM